MKHVVKYDSYLDILLMVSMYVIKYAALERLAARDLGRSHELNKTSKSLRFCQMNFEVIYGPMIYIYIYI